MKTEIFTEAWRLYRMYDMTFGEALSLAWNNFKLDALSDKLNLLIANGQGNVKEANELVSAIIPLNTKRNSFDLKLRIAVESNGAKHYYGKGLYNAD